MTEENVFGFMVIFAVVFVLGGIGFLSYNVEARKHELAIACVESGKSLVEGSCVRIAP